MPLLSDWVTVDDDGTINVRIGKVELGQGIVTALAQLAADALSVPLDRIRMLPASTRYGPDEGLTAGSLSVTRSGPVLESVCAQVRAMFGTGEITAAVNLDVPADLGSVSEHPRILSGRSVPRLDLPAKVAGLPVFIHDLRLPRQVFGRVLRPPSPGAVLRDLDPSRLDGLDVQVVRDGSFAGVVGADEAEVKQAVEVLRETAIWDERDTLPDENDLGAYLRSGPHETLDGPASGEPPAEGRTVHATYSRPFIAHASMAPSCAAARWNDDGTLSVWTHSQGVHPLRTAIARALDMDAERIGIDHVQGAGCYGHNAADDVAFDAVLLARAVPGRPAHVQWSRRDELTWAPFGSAMSVDVAAVVDDAGSVLSWEYDVWSQGHTSRPGYLGVPGLLAGAHLEKPIELPAAIDPPTARGAGSLRNANPIYDFPHLRITGHRVLHTPIRSSALRSLGAFMNVFAIESFMDELAMAAGADPLAYRLAHLQDARGRRVLERAAEASGWQDGTERRGIGFARYKDQGAYCAVVADVEAEHEVRVRRLTVAVDVGRVVNPDGVRNQIEGGAVQAASWTLKERVRFDRRRITSDDWESYPILRFSETPEVSVDLIDDPAEPFAGAGEAAQGPVAAAIANAAASALGIRVRDLPLTRDAIIAAIDAEG